MYKCTYRDMYLCFSFKDFVAATAKSLQSCPTLCDPIDSGPPGSHVPGILKARTLEWVAISFSNAWKWKVKVKLLSLVRLFEIPWTAAHQAPLSIGLSRQEYWSGVPSIYKYFLSPEQPSKGTVTVLQMRNQKSVEWASQGHTTWCEKSWDQREMSPGSRLGHFQNSVAGFPAISCFCSPVRHFYFTFVVKRRNEY